VALVEDDDCKWKVKLVVGVPGGEFTGGKLETDEVGDDVAEDAGVPE
jgi:hypothetical protein